MGGLSLDYLSKTFDKFGKRMLYIYAVIWSEKDYILGNLKDLVGVREGIVWAVASQLTQLNLRIAFGRRISYLCVLDILWCNNVECEFHGKVQWTYSEVIVSFTIMLL